MKRRSERRRSDRLTALLIDRLTAFFPAAFQPGAECSGGERAGGRPGELESHLILELPPVALGREDRADERYARPLPGGEAVSGADRSHERKGAEREMSKEGFHLSRRFTNDVQRRFVLEESAPSPTSNVGRYLMKPRSIPFTLGLLAGVTGCMKIVPVPSPREYIVLNQPKYVWVTTREKPVVRVELPSVRGDTLIGYVRNRPAIIPFSEITSATLHEGPNTDKLVKYSAGIGAAIVAGVLIYKVTHQSTFHSP